MRLLGAFGLVFLEAQILSTCISQNSFWYIFRKTMHNKTIIEFGVCDIRKNKGLGKCNQPRLITLASTLINLDIRKAEFNYCFVIHCFMESVQKL